MSCFGHVTSYIYAMHIDHENENPFTIMDNSLSSLATGSECWNYLVAPQSGIVSWFKVSQPWWEVILMVWYLLSDVKTVVMLQYIRGHIEKHIFIGFGVVRHGHPLRFWYQPRYRVYLICWGWARTMSKTAQKFKKPEKPACLVLCPGHYDLSCKLYALETLGASRGVVILHWDFAVVLERSRSWTLV